MDTDTAQSSQSRYKLRPRRKNCNIGVKTCQTRHNLPAIDPCKQKSERRLKRKVAKTDVEGAKRSKDNPLTESETTTSAEEEQDIKCVICLDTQDFKNILRLLCGHSFHGQCLTSWFEHQLFCPMCRMPQSLKEFSAFIKEHSEFLRQQIPEEPDKTCKELAKTIENMKVLIKQLKQLEMLCRAIFQMNDNDD